VGSYIAFAFSVYQLRNWILAPGYYPQRKFMRNLLINGSIILSSNILFLIDGIAHSFPESRLFYITYYLSLIFPQILHGIFFIFYGFLIRNKSKETDPTYISLSFGRKLLKVKKEVLSKLIVVWALSFILVSTSLLGNTAILKHINYEINYKINTGNPEMVAEKVETLDYPSLLKYRDFYGIIRDISNSSFDDHLITNYLDREYIKYLKEEIIKDSKIFHWWFGYRRSFNYELNANMVSTINFTHENGTIVRAQYENQEEIFTVRQFDYIYGTPGYWYINFSLIPYSVNKTSILLNNSVLITMVLDYDHSYGSLAALSYQVDQYLVLNENLQVLFIYVPKIVQVVS
jgi:hypothetical protein